MRVSKVYLWLADFLRTVTFYCTGVTCNPFWLGHTDSVCVCALVCVTARSDCLDMLPLTNKNVLNDKKLKLP